MLDVPGLRILQIDYPNVLAGAALDNLADSLEIA